MDIKNEIAKLSKITEEFANVEDECVQDNVRLINKWFTKINPEFENTARVDLGHIRRLLIESAKDTVYANGGEYEEAEAAGEAMKVRVW